MARRHADRLPGVAASRPGAAQTGWNEWTPDGASGLGALGGSIGPREREEGEVARLIQTASTSSLATAPLPPPPPPGPARRFTASASRNRRRRGGVRRKPLPPPLMRGACGPVGRGSAARAITTASRGGAGRRRDALALAARLVSGRRHSGGALSPIAPGITGRVADQEPSQPRPARGSAPWHSC